MEAVKNKVQLTGALSRDPQIGQFSNGRKWASVSLMISEFYQDAKGVQHNNTQWHPLKAFGKMADLFEKSCRKGTKIIVEGKLTSRTYTDSKGIKKYVTEVEVTEMEIQEKHEPMSHLT